MENKGITLIALIITIIVLLILAGISISFLTGDNGIINKAQSAKLESEKSAAKENLKLQITNLQTKLLSENSRNAGLDDVFSDLSSNSSIEIIDSETLLNTPISSNSYLIVKYDDYEFKIDNNLNVSSVNIDFENQLKDGLTHQFNTKNKSISQLIDLSGNNNNASLNGNPLIPNGTVSGTVTLKDENETYYTTYSGSRIHYIGK